MTYGSEIIELLRLRTGGKICKPIVKVGIVLCNSVTNTLRNVVDIVPNCGEI